MSGASSIEWTDATWNPVTGCSKVSPGCANCYAESYTERMAGQRGWIEEHRPWTPTNAEHNVRPHPERLDAPLHWRKPRMVFVNSMSDLFHELVSDKFIARVFATMIAAPQHIFQVLTKRPERMRPLLSSDAFCELVQAALQAMVDDPDDAPMPRRGLAYGLENVWLGTSIENRRFVHRADLLRETPAAVRFISAEPLLGPLVPDGEWDDDGDEAPYSVVFRHWRDDHQGAALDLTDIDWLIVGGESGDGHRPMRLEWVRDLRGAALAAGAAFFFKQWGGRTPKAGGRVLDGRTWDEYPHPPDRPRAEIPMLAQVFEEET